jgi:hypothetical protein
MKALTSRRSESCVQSLHAIAPFLRICQNWMPQDPHGKRLGDYLLETVRSAIPPHCQSCPAVSRIFFMLPQHPTPPQNKPYSSSTSRMRNSFGWDVISLENRKKSSGSVIISRLEYKRQNPCFRSCIFEEISEGGGHACNRNGWI